MTVIPLSFSINDAIDSNSIFKISPNNNKLRVKERQLDE
jgi:hypothetical protein